MTQSIHAFARPQTDKFLLSSLISRNQGNAPDPRSGGSLRISALTRMFVLGAALALAGCQAETAPAPTSQRPVQVQRVTFETGADVREFVGVVKARYETDLAFRVGGKIVSRNVNVGDQVKAGNVIARLDAQDLRLRVQSAEAELAAAKSTRFQAAADLKRYAALK